MYSIKRIIKIITITLVPVSLLLCYRQLFVVDQSFDRAVISIVAAISGMIPGGLVLLTSIVLAIGVIRLAAYNTLARDLYCIETLARVDMLCLDKTGTITEGKMRVKQVTGLQKNSIREIEAALNAYTFALSDNNLTFSALKEKYHEPVSCKPLIAIPFSSRNKWSLASYEELGSYILGAPEFILEKEFDELNELAHQYVIEGDRVLLFAYSPNQPVDRKLPEEIRPMALVVFGDKIRDNVKDTLDFFEKQGVGIKIISGDNPVCVSHIAGQAGVRGADDYIDASGLNEGEELQRAASHYTVFGRVGPRQKLELVKALKNDGHTVAMTGDGVNDVLALKEADCSIAMQNGSDAARNTSQLILLDSDFASMPKIVAEGKRSINNLQRSATLYLVKTIYASLLALLFIFINLPYPFAPIQITLIGALSIGIPSFFLALEKNNKRVKGKFIGNVLTLAIPGGLLVATVIMISICISKALNASVMEMATISTISAAIASLIVLFNLCRPFNFLRGALLSGIIMAFLAAVIFWGEIFNITGLDTHMILAIVLLGISGFVIHYAYINVVNLVVKQFFTKK